jgi:hypothetical protein
MLECKYITIYTCFLVLIPETESIVWNYQKFNSIKNNKLLFSNSEYPDN